MSAHGENKHRVCPECDSPQWFYPHHELVIAGGGGEGDYPLTTDPDKGTVECKDCGWTGPSTSLAWAVIPEPDEIQRLPTPEEERKLEEQEV